MEFLNKLKKFSFALWTLGFVFLGALTAKIFITYIGFSVPSENIALPSIRPLNLSLNLPKTPSTISQDTMQMPDDLSKLPNIDFQMQLVGSIITEDENASVVVVSYNGKDTTLSLNDELADGIVLVRLLPYRLVFDNKGRKQKYDWQEENPNAILSFEEGDTKLAQIDTPNTNNSTGTSMAPIEHGNISKPITTGKKEPVVGKSDSSKPKKVKMQQASVKPLMEKFGDDYRSTLLKNPFQLAKYVRLSPVRRDGRLAGYAVYPASDKSLFQAFGLERGDLLLSVNQIPTNNPRRMGELMQMLSEATSLDISIERKGNPIVINLPL